jgi:hypothetical protein
MDTTTLVLKADSRGWVSTPPERRAALLAEFARSGLSATQFAALLGVTLTIDAQAAAYAVFLKM